MIDLLSDDHRTNMAFLGSLPVTSRYTFGLAGERFFREIKNSGRIMGTQCQSCHKIYVPAAAFCERCLNELTEWIDMGNRGELATFTILHVNVDGSSRSSPLIVGYVRFGDGGLIHFLDEIQPDQVRIGMICEAVFKPQSERQGSILDITHFRPLTQD